MNKKQRTGRYIKISKGGDESFNAYLPKPLPPEPALDITGLYHLIDQANTALGEFNGASRLLPDPTLFLYMYLRKEAVLSSQIEGTQSSLSDLLLFETKAAPGVPLDDVREVSSYVSAIDYGLNRLKELPLSLRLIREIHAKLLDNTRGMHLNPGEFRTSQNWIGGSRPGNARFVPPPVEHLMECLGDFENFLHDETVQLPVLVKAALAHVQFETIHPFLDGNGRLGRLLITLILYTEGILKGPMLYLSLYFKTYRHEYYNHLQSVRETGDWEAWIKFFLIGVIETAHQATETAQLIVDLFNRDRSKIIESGKSTASIVNIHNYLQKQPVAKTKDFIKACTASKDTVLRSLKTLESIGIIEETTGKSRHKIFAYQEYLDLLNDELPSASQ